MKIGKVIGILLSIIFLILLLSACQPAKPILESKPEMPQDKGGNIIVKEKWQEEWDKTLVLARKEGKVTLYSTAGNDIRGAFMEAFPKKTGIVLEMTSGKSTAMTEKVLTERRNGLYLLDLFMSGLTSLMVSLKGANALDPSESAFILPEVMDTKLWFNKELPFIDKDRKVISYNARPGGSSTLINTSYIKRDEITTYEDLLKPQYKGKIIINDPTVSGSGLNWFAVGIETKKPGLDYMRMMAKQEPIINRDERLQVDWVAKGKYPIGIALDRETVNEYIDAGAPLEYVKLNNETLYLAVGGANIGLMSKAPHPNAARVFINWLLSKEGQTLNSRTEKQQSRRLDVPTDHLPPDLLRDPQQKYFSTITEEFYAKRLEFMELAVQVFTPEKK